ncbi:phosphoribosyltransferase [Methanocrinis sp.]|uniref:phosphoribosyltransferase n=1 Tax=Methanocrinis sp. TaxID=3101522 RepID=UPI003D14EEA2
MTAKIIEDPDLRDRWGVFGDRREAGEHLARFVERWRGEDAMVLAIPSGGVPIGLAVSEDLDLPLDLLIIRKIPIPGNPEAGFGAISLEGDLVLNPPLVRMLGLSAEEIEELSKPVREELEERNRLFREGRPEPVLRGKIAILVDDGLASGYTMMAAVRMVRRREPSRIVVAVPTASLGTVRLLAEEVDEIACPNIRSGASFAVADAYRNWYDLSREEVLKLLRDHDLLEEPRGRL